jgi:hypothetical protein
MKDTAMTISHSLLFMNPETGADTNTIESRWHHVKATLKLYNRKYDHMQHLADYVFRRKCKDEGVDTFCKGMLLISTDSSRSQGVKEEVE